MNIHLPSINARPCCFQFLGLQSISRDVADNVCHPRWLDPTMELITYSFVLYLQHGPRGVNSCSKSVKIRLVTTWYLQTCCKLLKQLASSLWAKSLNYQLASSLLTTCSIPDSGCVREACNKCYSAGNGVIALLMVCIWRHGGHVRGTTQRNILLVPLSDPCLTLCATSRD